MLAFIYRKWCFCPALQNKNTTHLNFALPARCWLTRSSTAWKVSLANRLVFTLSGLWADGFGFMPGPQHLSGVADFQAGEKNKLS
ncbi:MAG TPA: hypothetical protein PKW33_12710 [Anaerolineaceae bacterium]|nr:hypothetical protein [Anaerolineaceae bacterium]HPN52444.1 hypothetical protein [Anaerolineaceae bacterium]